MKQKVVWMIWIRLLTDASEDGEDDDEAGGDQSDVASAHVQPVPQELVQERAVIHHPDAEREQDHSANLTTNIRMKKDSNRNLEGQRKLLPSAI